jgi:hypothetical protein
LNAVQVVTPVDGATRNVAEQTRRTVGVAGTAVYATAALDPATR